jgi:hypothetical protein
MNLHKQLARELQKVVKNVEITPFLQLQFFKSTNWNKKAAQSMATIVYVRLSPIIIFEGKKVNWPRRTESTLRS